MTLHAVIIVLWILADSCCLSRVGIYYQLVSYMKEHFGDDAKGRKKAFYFLPWHFHFLCRYRHATTYAVLLFAVSLFLRPSSLDCFLLHSMSSALIRLKSCLPGSELQSGQHACVALTDVYKPCDNCCHY